MITIKTGSLFAGIGGFSLGLEKIENKNFRFETIWANEFDKNAAKTYRANFDHILLEGDIKFILNPEISDDPKKYNELRKIMFASPIDMLDAGFPCQSFSIAGNRMGFDDDRGNLFWSIIDFIKIHENRFGIKPKVLFLENVKNLTSHDNGKTFKVIKEEIESLGYTIKSEVLNTSEVTYLPQNRERIYLVCFLDETQSDKFDFKEIIKDSFFSKKSRRLKYAN